MRNQTDFQVMDEVSITYTHGGSLCLQAGVYVFPDDHTEEGFRFIWRDGLGGKMLPQRGQARLPDLRAATILIALAEGRPKFQGIRGADADMLPATIR